MAIGPRIKIWAIVRTYAREEKDVSVRVDRALVHARKIKEAGWYGGVLFVVPTDIDCGKTVIELENAFATVGNNFAEVIGIAGNENSTVLNIAFDILLGRKISFATVISGKHVGHHMTKRVVTDVVQALDSGYYAVGVRTAQSRTLAALGASELDNSFATWDIDEVLGVGGFKSPATEEVGVALAMLKKVGTEVPTIGIVEGNGDAEPNLLETQEAFQHHQRVLSTKLDNQSRAAKDAGVGLDFLLKNTRNLSFA